MQTRNTSESNSVSRNRSIQKSKHWNSEGRNVHKLATCSFEHVTRQDHATQSNQWLNAKYQTGMQINICSSDES